MLGYVNQNKIATNIQRYRIALFCQKSGLFYYVVFIYDIKLPKFECGSAFCRVFTVKKISFQPAKTSFCSAFADSRQSFRPLLDFLRLF